MEINQETQFIDGRFYTSLDAFEKISEMKDQSEEFK
jgi:hypothetical protein